MTATKEFVVKLAATDEDEWALSENEVYTRLTDAVGYSGYFWVESVKRMPLVGKVFSGKIPAIKEIRSLLELSLIDAKHMVDAATAMGEFQLMKIIVTYSHDNGQYVVTDAR